MQSLLLGRRYFAWVGEETDRPYMFRIFPIMGFAPYLSFNNRNKGLTSMKYVKAEAILPENLLKEIQRYVQGETIYIPKPKKAYRKWGTHSGTRALIDERNACIQDAFKNGKTIDQLAFDYHLSCETIKKIVYRK
jgi:hypothetical protein